MEDVHSVQRVARVVQRHLGARRHHLAALRAHATDEHATFGDGARVAARAQDDGLDRGVGLDDPAAGAHFVRERTSKLGDHARRHEKERRPAHVGGVHDQDLAGAEQVHLGVAA